jgi:hypothetical protein
LPLKTAELDAGPTIFKIAHKKYHFISFVKDLVITPAKGRAQGSNIVFSIAHFQGYDEQILCIPPFIEIGREPQAIKKQHLIRWIVLACLLIIYNYNVAGSGSSSIISKGGTRIQYFQTKHDHLNIKV